MKMVDPRKISMGTINRREDSGDLTELATNIMERHRNGQRGVIIPLIVRRLEGNDKFDWELIDGKRRLQASLMVRLSKVPVVEETDEENVAELLIMSYLSNEQRKEFHWMERAKTFRELHNAFGMTYKDIGTKVGLSESRVITYVTTLNKLEKAIEPSRAKVLDMSTIEEIVDKCPEEDIPELIQFAIDNDISRDDMRKILFALRNFYADQQVLGDFDKILHDELYKVYSLHRFNPKILSLYKEELKLRTGELRLIDYYLDIDDYPTRESAEEYADRYHGEVVRRITKDGWQLCIYPTNFDEIREKLKKLIEKE